jgi:LPXTG-motif cell wall-anchored protein
MRRLSTAISILCFGVFLAAGLGRAAAADDSSWKSQLHLSQPTEIPGKVLEPGDYVVKVLDTKQPRKIVQFSNADDTKVIATVMAIPDYRVQPAERVEFTYFQRGSNAPQALKEWFYVGNNYGIEFVYRKPAAYEIAKNSNENVVMTQTENNNEEIKEVTPEQKEVTYESRNETPAPAPAPAPEAAPRELPKTGSDLPSVALAGAILLAGAATLRLARRRNA